MATIKSYTNISQSKKLAEILPLESADMFHFIHEVDTVGFGYKKDVAEFYSKTEFKYIPCWSLSALFGVLPNNKHITTTLSRGGWKIEPVEYIDKWFCEYEDEVDEDSPSKNFSVSADNPVDACYELILKLHELKML